MSDGRNPTQPVVPRERRDAFWRTLLAPDTEYENEPDDGHEHDFHLVGVPRTGPIATACLACGWLKAWGEAK